MVQIKTAKSSDSQAVSSLVTSLFLELEPEAEEEINSMNLPLLIQELIEQSKIMVYLAFENNEPIGVVTLNEYAAIYAGGIFVQISEIYIAPPLPWRGSFSICPKFR